MENDVTPQVETRELDETELDGVAGGFQLPRIVQAQQTLNWLEQNPITIQ